MSDWVYSQIRARYTDEDLVELLGISLGIPELSVDLWAHLLSFVDRRDVFNVLQVCRKWHDATRTRTFWARMGLHKLREACNGKIPELLLKHYDPFFPVPEKYNTLMHCVGWICGYPEKECFWCTRISFRSIQYIFVVSGEGSSYFTTFVFGETGRTRIYRDIKDDNRMTNLEYSIEKRSLKAFLDIMDLRCYPFETNYIDNVIVTWRVPETGQTIHGPGVVTMLPCPDEEYEVGHETKKIKISFE